MRRVPYVLVLVFSMLWSNDMFADGNDKHYDFAVRSAEAGLVCNDPSLTVQSQMEDA